MNAYFHVPPIALGTVEVECLSSLLHRISYAHGVSRFQFISHLQSRWRTETDNHLPRCEELRWDGYSPNVSIALSALNYAFGYDLEGTTLIALQGICAGNSIGSIKHERCWCPACLKGDREAGRPPYDRLLWRVQGVERCSLHKLRLRRNCPHCESGQTKDSSKVELDQCSTCGQSLASLTSIRDYSPRPLFGEEQTEQLILRLGELRGAASGSLRVFLSNLSSPAKDWGKHLGDIFHTRQCPILPQLTSLIAVATHFGVDIVQLITSPASAAAQSGLEIGKASPRKMRRPSSHLRANRTAWFRKELEAALAGGPPYPSTAQFCRSRDYSATAARNSFPWLTGQLSALHRECSRAELERRTLAAAKVIRSLPQDKKRLPVKVRTRMIAEQSGAPMHVVRRILSADD
ncbi:TniQ family protein [Stenotrophomonas maltophilia]|uniref:TniQ family protein n=1 Tax=Stenotrophomonas maltophilia TaxID=40324 RepID=UPI00332D15CB